MSGRDEEDKGGGCVPEGQIAFRSGPHVPPVPPRPRVGAGGVRTAGGQSSRWEAEGGQNARVHHYGDESSCPHQDGGNRALFILCFSRSMN